MKNKTVEDYKAEIRMLKDELEHTSNLRYRYQRLASQHRAFLRGKFEWFVDVCSENKTPNLAWLIKDVARHFSLTGDMND